LTEPREPLRLPGRRGRRLDPVRLAAAVVLAVATLWLGVLGARRGAVAVRAWLHAQPAYQVRFDAIALDPPPPDWLRPGANGLLEGVRKGAGRPETLALLDLDLDALAQDFRRESPWVRAVRGIDRAYPDRLVVALEYRRPVALLRLGKRRIVLDADGVVLPEEAVDLARAGPLVLLALAGTAEAGAPLDARPGRVLGLAPAGAPPAEPARVPAALAGLLRKRGAVAASGTKAPAGDGGPAVAAIQTDAQGRLWVELAGGSLVHWGRADGTREPGDPDDSQKLDALAAWLRDHPAERPIPPRFLAFDHDRLVVVPPRGAAGS
jgi:hypothetical protein